MALPTKVRPTFTLQELALLVRGVEELMDKHIRAGDFSNPILLRMMKLKTYCDSFQAVERDTSDAALLAKYIASQGIAVGKAAIEGTVTGVGQELETPIVVAQEDLTDDQRYDLLSLRDSSERTEEENIWYLNVGTMVAMRRMAKSKVPVKASDL